MPDDEGQVSEASSLENAGDPIQPDQAVAGAPDAESGEVQEGRTGPNARTGDETSDNAGDETSENAGDEGEDQAAIHG